MESERGNRSRNIYSTLSLIALPLASLGLCAIFLKQLGNFIPTEAGCIDFMFPDALAREEIDYHWRTFDEVGFLIESPSLGKPVPDSDVEEAWRTLMPCKQSCLIQRWTFSLTCFQPKLLLWKALMIQLSNIGHPNSQKLQIWPLQQVHFLC